MKRAIIALLLLAAPAAAQEAWLPKSTADLIVLDKIRGQPSKLAVDVGKTARFGSLQIAVRNCVVRPPDQAADAAAFVDVTEANGPTLFSGWLLLNTPSLSAMENPVYDVRLAGCH